MKRSSWLFFALMLIFQFNPGMLFAGTILTNGVVELFTDADNNGYVNRGDTIRVSCIAAFTAPATAWQLAPYVDLGSIGMGTVTLNDNGGGNYSANITLNNWNPGVNHVTRTVTIRARADDLTSATQFANIMFDLCQVEGAGAEAVNSVTLLNSAKLNERLRIRITDNKYQNDPLGGTICTVNLTPIGGNALTPMSANIVTGVFEVLSDPIPAGINYNGPLTITLNDPMPGHPAVGYQTGNIVVDSGAPTVDFTNTTVVIQSGNATALPGDVLRITAAVTAFDNETVTAYCEALDNGANPPLNPAYPLELRSSNGVGNPAVWQLDVVLSAENLKNSSLPIIIRFTDDAGNYTTVTRYIAIDLDAPNILSSLARVLFPDSTVSDTPNTATTTCKLEFTSQITIAATETIPLTVTIDLSEIGASAQYPMTRIPSTNTYRAVYTVPQGSLEDVIDYEFTVSARDAAGNLVAQTTAPPIRIDNNPPVLTNIQMTSNNPNNSNIVRVGDSITVSCTATGLETNGKVWVDLSFIGASATENLPHVGGNVYRRSFVLLDAANPLVPGVIDDFTSFTVYANDTIMGGSRVGHIVEGLTNQLMIDNEPPNIIDSAFDSDIVPTPTVFITGNSVKFYARVITNPVTVTINMMQLNQGNAENMVPSTSANPSLQAGDGWYEYILPGGIPEGLIDGIPRSFRVTATDDAGNTDTTGPADEAPDISITIDNKPIKVIDFDVNVTYRNDPPGDTDISIVNLNKKLEFTISLDSTTAVSDLGTATIDLSKFGGKTNAEELAYSVPDHAYELTTDDYTELEYDSSSHRFTVTITDKSGNKTIAQSAQRRVDNWPPLITLAQASLPAGGTMAKIGDTILFEAKVSRNEGVAPEINLSSLGLSSAQAMSLVSTTSGISLYQHSAVVANGTSNNVVASWTITARDNDLNFVASNTNTLQVDSLPPQIQTALNVTDMVDSSYIRLGENITFTLVLEPTDTTIDTVTVDMRAIGMGASETLPIDVLNSIAQRTVTTLLTTSEYTNHRFTATITDTAGNKATSQSQTFTEVDCRPVIFTDSGMLLWQDNGFVNPGYAGPGDVVMVWANATYYQDAVVTANLATGTSDFASATMTFNTTRNRHEGLFTIATATALPANWPMIGGNLTYRVRAVDNVNNVSSTAYTVGNDFEVRNFLPTALVASMSLSPNYYLATSSSNLLVYNLGNSITGDGLVATVTFANNLIVHKAWLDFREFGTGTVDLRVDDSSSAVTVSGYTVNRLPAINDGIPKRVWLYAMDKAGNATYTSERMFVDNVAPTLVSAEFDGSIVSVGLSEIFDSDSFYYDNWQIVGSSSLGAPVNLKFTPPPVGNAYLPDMSSFQLELTNDQLRTMSEWASTPIYLKVTNENATSAVTDMWGNELRPVNYYPITITSSAWREPARITHFTMNQTWPNTITIDLLFSKAMDENSVAASAAVMLLGSDTTQTFENNVDYNLGYVFQAASTNPLASDTFVWKSSTHLQITLCETGRRWVARKLTNNTSRKLYFAARNVQKPFVVDFLGKPVTHIAASSPLQGVDNRPVASFAFKGPADDPKLNIGQRTLVLSATDLLLLSNSNYNGNGDVPYLIEPTPTFANRATGFHGNIILHESNSNSVQTLQLDPLSAAANPLFASSTVTLHLSDQDLVNILALYQANPSPIWEMTIKAGAFTNIWGNPNLAYLPSDYPGSMVVATGTPLTGAMIAAVSMSDKPPVSAKAASELTFEVEVFPPDIDGIPLPLQWQTTPKAAIFRQDTGAWLASGTFINYSERTVDGRLRGVFRYQNTAVLPTTLQNVPAVVNVYGVTDIFGNSANLTASYAYDLTTKNDGALEGFNDTASAAIVLDTMKPVVSSVIPNDFIGKIPAGSIFRVNFNEEMNAAVIPTLTLATSTETMTFSFSGWSATATAEFTNNAAFIPTMPNGYWYYQVSGGADIAGNVTTTHGATAFPVQVRTYAPEVAAGDVVMRTVQNTISPNQLINEPWSRYVGNAVFSVSYTTAPTQTHYLEIYDPVSNTLQGRVPLTVSGTLATATVSTINAAMVGPNNYAVRIVDSLNNRTDNLLSIVYDGLAPNLTSFAIGGSGVGSTTADYTYFNPLSGDMILDFVAVTTDNLRLAVYNGTATSTQLLNDSGTVGEYFLATGSGYANGTYTFTVVDLAGNKGIGQATRRVVADSIAPNMVSIIPAHSVTGNPPYYLGLSAAAGTEVQVKFSEPMNVDPALLPTLTLGSGSNTINWDFKEWIDQNRIAVYTNREAIDSTFVNGVYTFALTGGVDLANNARNTTLETPQQATVYISGPFARITNYTIQEHIYGLTPQADLAYNPAYGSATLRINITGDLTPPYSLIVFSGITEVGSIGLPNANQSDVNFADIVLAPPSPPSVNYTLKVRNPQGDSPGYTFKYDTIMPVVNSISMTGQGSYTADISTGLTYYHSPILSDSTVTMITAGSDEIKLLVASTTATSTTSMVAAGGATNHQATLSALGTLPEGTYLLTAVDLAGNLADGTASRARLIIDTTSPNVTSATPILAGALATGAGVFEIVFSEPMNSAFSPSLQIASDAIPAPIQLQFSSWISSTTCRFSNPQAIAASLPPGTYSYLISSSAKDLAGNLSIATTEGEFTVELFTLAPVITAPRITSRQLEIWDNKDLVNYPLSFEANSTSPDVATLSFTYNGLYQTPHTIHIYRNSGNIKVASFVITPDGATDVPIDNLALGNPAGFPGGTMASYSFVITDNIGNVGASYNIPITYDGRPPVIATTSISNVFVPPAESTRYYNGSLGPLNVSFVTAASTATDSLVLAIAGIASASGNATYSYEMSTNLTTGVNTYSVASSTIPDGTYWVTSVDRAGNYAVGAATMTALIVDRTAPDVVLATTSNNLGAATGLAIVSSPAGQSYFKLQFGERMRATASPTLAIASGATEIGYTFVNWLTSDTAIFKNTASITNALPQGTYTCKVSGTDIAGNSMSISTGTVEVRSRGPIVSSFYTTSYQSTTASATLASGLEMLTNQPFSFNVDPKAATLSVQLAQIPDGNPANIWLHFMLDNTTTASYPVALIGLNGLNATFTWSISNGPASDTSYTIRVADANGDLSRESMVWRNDSVAPQVQSVVVTGGEPATASVYFNPERHRYLVTRFAAVEVEAPRLRIRGSNSTDTYDLAAAGTNLWSTNFEGHYSRGDKARLPDASYTLDLVDRAGNFALASDGQPIKFDVIIDSAAPVIATYTLAQNSQAVTSFTPAAGDLEVIVLPQDLTMLLTKENLWWIEVLDNSGTRVKRLPLENATGTYRAFWNGTNDSGSLVLDGTYTLVAADYAGNRATLTTEVFARTTPFRVLAIEQVSSSSARIWFNHDVNENSWFAAIDPIIASPPRTISNLTRDQERSITFDVSSAFEHGISYIFTVATDSIKSVFGAPVDEDARTVILLADGRGPVISGVSFHGLAGQQEFRVEFDENYTAISAGNKSNYTLVSASGPVTVANAITQSDLRSVILTASPALVENASYTITANNIVDGYGNATSSSYAFKGRDLTPPELAVSAFSNPANENDIIVVVTSNELLKSSPQLSVAQSNAPVVTTVMQQGAEPTSYMMGVSLSPSYAGNGTLRAEAQDLAGNSGFGTTTFTVAYVSSIRASVVQSADSVVTLNFTDQSLKNDATVRILQHKLEKTAASGGAIRTSLQKQFRAAIGSLRGSQATDTVLLNHSELFPVTDAYEIGILKEKINKGFSVNLISDKATSTIGLGLFNQVGDSWHFITASRDKEGVFAARTGSSQIFAIMFDAVAPQIALDSSMNLIEPFRTARPEFKGNIVEAGSGLKADSVKAYLDNGPAQSIQVDAGGNFAFIPMADLVAGNHDLVIEATDNTGNVGKMASTRFSVTLPLSIGQIMQYPNPASRRAFIRISANRGDLSSDLVKVTIYDVAGHKVGSLDDVRAVRENWGINARYLYDIPWDLSNKAGKQVANGVYFAKIEVRDPDDPSIKTRKNFKLAVLR